jgi:hypothetical protein
VVALRPSPFAAPTAPRSKGDDMATKMEQIAITMESIAITKRRRAG